MKLSRRRRLVWAAAVGAGLVMAAAAAPMLFRRGADRYDPSAAVEGITSELARSLPADVPRVTFTDRAADAGIAFRHFHGARSTQLPEDMGSGAAWGDYDGDGDDDLFVANIAGPLTMAAGERDRSPATSRLYRNNGDGTFADVTRAAGVELRQCGLGAAWGDIDGDGRLDLVVTAFPDLRLFRNRGDGTFADVTAASGLARHKGFWTGTSWADFDRDGDLDLYVCGYVQYKYDADAAAQVSMQFEAEVPTALNPSSYVPQPNLLLRNDGRGRFTDVATAAGVANPTGRSLSAAWADFDLDGWLDLYVANDVSDNALYRNLGNGRFEDISHTSWVADPRGAMGLGVGDFDLDGDFDIFVTHWLAQENALYSNMLIGAKGGQPGRLVFMDVADQHGVGQASLDYVKWGTSFFDYDNDMRPDLLSVNGSTFQDERDKRQLVAMRHQLFWNKGDVDGFFDVAPVAGAVFQTKTVGRGAAFSDYDRDGDVDVFVVNHGGPAWLLRNEGGNRRGWVQVAAVARTGAPAMGALVRVTAGGRTAMQQVGAQSSYLSQNSAILHFGLGEGRRAETVAVTFPGGPTVTQSAVAAGTVVRIVEPAP